MKRLLVAACACAVSAATPVSAQVAEDAPPRPPSGAATNFVPPERDAGGYRTPNRDLSPGEAVWHVRAALNVAALECRGPADGTIAAAYNALLDADREALAAAASAEAQYRARHGAAWRDRFDGDMTRLYNFFAQPVAHDGFCASADMLLRESHEVPPANFAAFAVAALPRLEAPFTAFFADWDGYRDALAAWQRRHAPVVIATAAPVPVGPRLGPDSD